MELDNIERRILHELLRDARTNFVDIARECDVSITTISKRFQKMKQSGLIGKSVLMPSLKLTRIEHGVAAGIKVEIGFESTIIEAIEKIPEVFFVAKVIGKYDLVVTAFVKSLDQINEIVNKIGREKGVVSVEVTTSVDEMHFFPENFSPE